MKGLLHRLAARAAGTAPLVRSDARLPFGGGGLAGADETLDANGGSARELPVTGTARADAAMQRAVQAPTRASVITSTETSIEPLAELAAVPSRQAHPRPAVTLPDAMLHASEPSAPQGPVSQRHDGSQTEPEPRVLEAAPMAAAPVMTSQTHEPRVREAAPRHANGMPFERDNQTPVPSAAHRSDGSTRRAGASPLVEPSPLMPLARAEVDTSMPRIVRLKAARPLAPGSQAADDTTEVHIHIGRVEVTAVHEAPEPSTQPRKRQAPMSLDAYLAARKKA